MEFVAYYRVSTRKQGESGLGFEAQREAVAQSIGIPPIHEFIEVETGRNNERQQLQEALRLAKLTGATLVVAKLDRLSRNAEFLNKLFNGSVPLRIADMPFADRFTIGIMAQVAQWEAEVISKRTREALQASKARGTKLGGDRGNIRAVGAQGRAASILVRQQRSQEWKALVGPSLARARAEGHTSLRAMADYLNERKIKSPRGGAWHAASVARVLEGL